MPRPRYDLIVPLKKIRRDGPRSFTNNINHWLLVENDDEDIEDKMITLLNLFYDDANPYRGLRTHDSAGRVANERATLSYAGEMIDAMCNAIIMF